MANKGRILKSLSNKQVKQFLLFCGLAFFFLLLTKLSDTYTKDIEFKVSIDNVPKSNSLVNKDALIKAKLKSTGFELLPYFFKKPSISLDASHDLSLVDNKYLWISSSNAYTFEEVLGNDFEILSLQPDSLFFEFQKMATKKVPVKLKSEISYAIGYDSFYRPNLNPDSVTVIGAEKLVSAIEFIETETLSLNKANKSISKTLNLSKRGIAKDIELSVKKIDVELDIEKFTEGVVNSPITILNIPDTVKINYFPKTVPIYYYTSLKHYKAISINDFKILADFNSFTSSSSGELGIELKTLTDKVKAAKIKQNSINIIIKE